MSRSRAYRYAVKSRERKSPMNPDNKETVIDWMTKHSTDHSIITPLYDRFDRATRVLASQWCKGQKQFLVQWAPTPCRVRHIPLHIERGYKVPCTAPYTGNQLDSAGEEICWVTWEPKREAAYSFCHVDHPEQITLAAEFADECDGLDNHIDKGQTIEDKMHIHQTWTNKEHGSKGSAELRTFWLTTTKAVHSHQPKRHY